MNHCTFLKYYSLAIYIQIFGLFPSCKQENKETIQSHITIDTNNIYHRLPCIKILDSLEEIKAYTFLPKLIDSLQLLAANKSDLVYFNYRRSYTNLLISKDESYIKMFIQQANTFASKPDYWNQFYLFKSYAYLHKYKAAESLIKHIEIKSQVETFNYITYLSHKTIGDYYLGKEEYENADSQYNQALDIINQIRYSDSTTLITLFYQLGNVKRQQSEYELSSHYLRNALDLESRHCMPHIRSKIQTDLAIVLSAQAYYEEANDLIDTSLSTAKKIRDTSQIARSLFVKAIFNSFSGNYKAAKEFYDEELKLPSKFYTSSEVYIRIIQNAISAKDISTSKYFYAKVFKSFDQFGKEKKAYLKSIESKYYFLIKDYVKALKSIQESILLLDNRMYTKTTIDAPTIKVYKMVDMSLYYLGLKAKLLTDIYQNTINTKYLNKSIEMYTYIDSLFIENCRFPDDGDELHAMDIMNQVYFEAQKALSIIYENTHEYKYLELSNTFSERIRAKRFYRNLTSKNLIASSKNIKLITYLKAEDSLSQIIDLFSINNAATDLQALLNERENIYIQIKNEFPMEYRQLYNIDVCDIAKAVNWSKQEGFTIIQFLRGEDGDVEILKYNPIEYQFKYFAKESSFAISLAKFGLNLDSDSLKNVINSFILDTNDAKNYVIIPDASLSALPLHILFTKHQSVKGKTSDNIVLYTFLLSNLINNNLHSLLNKIYSSALSISNADKGDVGLPYSYLESKYIESLNWNHFTAIRGKNASFQNFTNNLNNKDLIHIALHGKASSTSNTQTGLYFSDKFVSNNDFISLNNSSLAFAIILNSCESLNGKSRIGEGIDNLSRIFAVKGSKIICAFDSKLNDLKSFNLTKILVRENKIFYNVYDESLFIYIN